MKRIAIIGSRDWPEKELYRVRAFVQRLPAGTVVVSGGARGVDQAVEQAVRRLGLPVTIYKPQYSLHGTPAPLIRNRQIIDAADEVVAFHAVVPQ